MENPEGYDDQGAMPLPFDQLYPELVENEQVAFDDETLLVKLSARGSAEDPYFVAIT